MTEEDSHQGGLGIIRGRLSGSVHSHFCKGILDGSHSSCRLVVQSHQTLGTTLLLHRHWRLRTHASHCFICLFEGELEEDQKEIRYQDLGIYYSSDLRLPAVRLALAPRS